MVFLLFTIGTTFSGNPEMLTVKGGLSSLINRVSSTCLPCGPTVDCQPATNPSWPFVMQSSVASLFLSIIGMPMQRDNLPGKCSVAPGWTFQISSCSSKLISLDVCLSLKDDFAFPFL